ncbi:hypothetical protein OUZ56_026925 [Daphnia magna]|uniref:Uncharacterized protein n=1 Tax=Daphnia magna TaxID=35525 RepID=A0ABQ9ZN86_9CRUS|nr:hypothetical protein OUZ56_026925 [Daphnia magna]
MGLSLRYFPNPQRFIHSNYNNNHGFVTQVQNHWNHNNLPLSMVQPSMLADYLTCQTNSRYGDI